MSTLISRAKLIRRIMKEQGSWQGGQDLPQEDYQNIDDELDAELAAMAKADIFVVEDPAAGVPAEAYSELAAYLAFQLARVAGIGEQNEVQQLGQRAALAEKALRYLRKTEATYQSMQPDYF